MNDTHQGMGHRRMRTEVEYDVVKWRHVFCWTKRAGAVSGVKRSIRRRERREARQRSWL